MENAARVGNHIKQCLNAEFLPLPCVGIVDGMGINYALELVNNKETRTPISPDVKAELLEKIFENSIYARIIGRHGNRLHVGPPCTTTIEEADKALDIIKPLVKSSNLFAGSKSVGMSRFIDKLNLVSQAIPRPLGFRAVPSASLKPKIQLIGSLAPVRLTTTGVDASI